MIPDLQKIPFDHYQRYATGAGLIGSLETPPGSILEVGANRQRLLGRFFPRASILYTDIELTGDDDGFVVADATRLPFADGQFDAVLCLDVLEHIPAELRSTALQEMARVTSGIMVVGCPTDYPWVHDAEEAANGHWRDLFGGDYPWLSEHKEFGLVDGDAAEQTLAEHMPFRLRFAQGEPKLWASLMGAHFLKERLPELSAIVSGADSLYNASVFQGDRPTRGYREFFVGTRAARDEASVRKWVQIRQPGDPASLEYLRCLSNSIRPVVDRVKRSDDGWAEASELYHAQSTELRIAKEEWGRTSEALSRIRQESAEVGAALATATTGWEETLVRLREVEAERDEISADLDKANRAFATSQAGWEEAVLTAAAASAGWEEAVAAASTAGAGWEEAIAAVDTATAGWDEAVAAVNALEADRDRLRAVLAHVQADLTIAKREWGATAQSLGASTDRLAEAVVAARSARAGWEEAIAALDTATAGWEEAVAAVKALEADRDRLRAVLAHVQADLAIAKREWGATAQSLGASTDRLAEAMVTVQALEADRDGLQVELSHVRGDLEVSKREWGDTAEALVAVQIQAQRVVDDLARERNDRLAAERTAQIWRRRLFALAGLMVLLCIWLIWELVK